jgi:hypothetical protein
LSLRRSGDLLTLAKRTDLILARRQMKRHELLADDRLKPVACEIRRSRLGLEPLHRQVEHVDLPIDPGSTILVRAPSAKRVESARRGYTYPDQSAHSVADESVSPTPAALFAVGPVVEHLERALVE